MITRVSSILFHGSPPPKRACVIKIVVGLTATQRDTDRVAFAPRVIDTGADKPAVHRKTAAAVTQVGVGLMDTAAVYFEKPGTLLSWAVSGMA